MRTIEISLSDYVYSHLELRAAIDDLRVQEAVALLLSEIVMTHKERKK
jgi:hypothetical protein